MNQSLKTLVSFAFVALVWWYFLGSIQLAVGLLVCIFVHEMGHYLACRHKGLSTGLPVFMPWGAQVSYSGADSASTEAFVAFAGPLFGTLSGLIALTLGYVLSVPDLLNLAFYTFVLNLFNMVPISPLDGGGISMGIHRHLWILGLPLLVWLLFTWGFNTFNMIIVAFVVMQFVQNWRFRKMLPESYFQVPFAVRIGYLLSYLALSGLLVWLIAKPQGFLILLLWLGL